MILTTNQVAERLGITPRAVRKLAERHHVGTLITARTRVYSEDDVRRLAERVGKRGQHITRPPSAARRGAG